jgi:hypothetical protein
LYGEDRKVVVPVMPAKNVAISTKMTIENQTGVAIRIVTDHCGSPTWFSLHEEEHKNQLLTTFCPCACNADFTRSTCPSCGQCAADQTVLVAAGASYSTTWDGNFWNLYPSGCSAQYAMPTGFPGLIQICYTKAGEATPMCVYQQTLGTLGEEQRFVVTG